MPSLVLKVGVGDRLLSVTNLYELIRREENSTTDLEQFKVGREAGLPSIMSQLVCFIIEVLGKKQKKKKKERNHFVTS